MDSPEFYKPPFFLLLGFPLRGCCPADSQRSLSSLLQPLLSVRMPELETLRPELPGYAARNKQVWVLFLQAAASPVELYADLIWEISMFKKYVLS